MKTICLSLLVASLSTLTACERPFTTRPTPPQKEDPLKRDSADKTETSTKLKPARSATQAPRPTVQVIGVVEGAGVSRGKTLAAWNGIPVGEMYLKLRLGANQARPTDAPEVVFLRIPAKQRDTDWKGASVRVWGEWIEPAPVVSHVDDGLGHMMQVQAPIEIPEQSAPSASEGPGIVSREPIFFATRIEVTSPAE